MGIVGLQAQQLPIWRFVTSFNCRSNWSFCDYHGRRKPPAIISFCNLQSLEVETITNCSIHFRFIGAKLQTGIEEEVPAL